MPLNPVQFTNKTSLSIFRCLITSGACNFKANIGESYNVLITKVLEQIFLPRYKRNG